MRFPCLRALRAPTSRCSSPNQHHPASCPSIAFPAAQILDTPCDDGAALSSPASSHPSSLGGAAEPRGPLLEALLSKNLSHPCIVQTFEFAVHTAEASGGYMQGLYDGTTFLRPHSF